MRWKNKLAALLLAACVASQPGVVSAFAAEAGAQTWSGQSWSLASGKWVVRGDAEVPSGRELVIAPGAELTVESGTFRVNGMVKGMVNVGRDGTLFTTASGKTAQAVMADEFAQVKNEGWLGNLSIKDGKAENVNSGKMDAVRMENGSLTNGLKSSVAKLELTGGKVVNGFSARIETLAQSGGVLENAASIGAAAVTGGRLDNTGVISTGDSDTSAYIHSYEQRTNDEFWYQIRDGKEAVITHAAAGQSSVSYPRSIDGVPVVELKKDTFFQVKNTIQSIQIPNTVTVIGEGAFQESALGSLVLPSSVAAVGNRAFYKNLKLRTADLGAVASLGEEAFSGCVSLENVSVPSTVGAIGKGAFSGATGLKQVKLVNGLKVISSSAFDGCTSLTAVDIPDSVETIGRWAFANCTSLKTVKLGRGVKAIDPQAFSQYTGTQKEAAAWDKSVAFSVPKESTAVIEALRKLGAQVTVY